MITPTLLTAIIGLLTALPEIFTLANAVMTFLNKGGTREELLQVFDSAYQYLQTATTVEEKQNVAKTLSDAIAKLPNR